MPAALPATNTSAGSTLAEIEAAAKELVATAKYRAYPGPDLRVCAASSFRVIVSAWHFLGICLRAAGRSRPMELIQTLPMPIDILREKPATLWRSSSRSIS
jgi:hypothetical protein